MAIANSTFELASNIIASLAANTKPALPYEKWLELFNGAMTETTNEEQLNLLNDADCAMQAWLIVP